MSQYHVQFTDSHDKAVGKPSSYPKARLEIEMGQGQKTILKAHGLAQNTVPQLPLEEQGESHVLEGPHPADPHAGRAGVPDE